MSNETKKNLEIAGLIVSLLLAIAGFAKAWALTPYRLDELAASQAETSRRIERQQGEATSLFSDIRVKLATIEEGHRAYRRDIDEIKSDVKEIKAKR